jgi:hypothetical protein
MSIAVYRPQLFTGSPETLAVMAGSTLLDIVSGMKNLPDWVLNDGVVTVNGDIIPREWWGKVRPKQGAIVNVYASPQGGGGGQEGGRRGKGGAVLALVASVALLFVTAGISGGSLAGTLGSAFAANTIGAKALAAGVGLVGALAISALTAPPTPKARGVSLAPDDRKDRGAAGANGNIVDIGAALPYVIGTHKIFPPLIAQPLVELIGKDEYVEAVYALAHPHELNDIRIGDVDIDEAQDVEYETREGWDDDASLSLVTRQGRTETPQIELSIHDVLEDDKDKLVNQFDPTQSSPVWHRVVTRKDPCEVWLHMQFQALANTNSVGTFYRVPLRIRIRRRGTTTWQNLPEVHFKQNKQEPIRLQARIYWCDGSTPAFNVPNDGFVAAFTSVPAGADAPFTGGWTANGYFSKSATGYLIKGNESTTGVQNVLLGEDNVDFYLDETTFPKDFYEIEVMRGAVFAHSSFTDSTYDYGGSVKDFFGYRISGSDAIIVLDRSNIIDKLFLTRVCSVWNETPIAKQRGLALIALKAKNRSIQDVSTIASGYVKDWDGSSWATWSTTANPAPWYYEHLRGDRVPYPLAAGLVDNDRLLEWRTACDDEGYNCNAVFDSVQIPDALNILASTGYARPYYNNTYGVIRDYDRSDELPTQYFTPMNSAGFSFTKAFPKLPDGFRVTYRDEDTNYDTQEIIVYREGITSGDFFEQITVEGITNEADVTSRAGFDLKQAVYRNVFYSFRCGAESIKAQRGDLIGVTHDVLTRVASFGRISLVELDEDQLISAVTLENEVFVWNYGNLEDITALEEVEHLELIGANGGVAIQNDDGVVTTHAIDNETGYHQRLVFTTPFFNNRISSGCMLSSGSVGTEYGRYIITNIKPSKDGEATIECVDEAQELWQ